MSETIRVTEREDILPDDPAELKKALAERELVLREVNHRVANSIQLTTSILRMQAHMEADPHTKEQLDKAALRISAIRHVHDQLHHSGVMESVEIAPYLRDLTTDLAAALPIENRNGQRFRVSAQADELSLPTDWVSKIGVVVTECVSNASRHGRPASGDCVINVTFRRSGDHFALSIADNGTGVPEGYDPQTAKGLGLRLAKSVAGGLGGEIKAQNDPGGGAVFTITLPPPKGWEG